MEEGEEVFPEQGEAEAEAGVAVRILVEEVVVRIRGEGMVG